MSKIKGNLVLSPLSNGENAEKAIRLSLQFPLRHDDFYKNAFNPQQPRNNRGEWGAGGGPASSAKAPKDRLSVVDGYCMIVKKLCIIEATETLPTIDFGMTFFQALNACMDRHGCLGRA